MKLQPGDPAPDFTLPDQDGRPVSLSDYRGRRVVVYFYPRDDTPGCTREACQFNDALAQFVGLGIDVLGVSADDGASHRRFRARYGLDFNLLTDASNVIGARYGAFGEKMLYGRPTTGVIRSTFLIDGQGRVEKAWYGVRADGHAAQVLAEVTKRSKGAAG
jgi:peroxiredoxin Q/BCP